MATDTNWIFTYPVPGIQSVPPVGDPLWSPPGYSFTVVPGGVSMAVMEDFAPLHVEAGEKIFISIRLYTTITWLMQHDEKPPEDPSYYLARSYPATTSDPYYPSRAWIFYEHDKGPSGCGDTPIDSIPRGWVARGGLSGDSTDVLLWDIWYSMTVTSNKPPVVEGQSPLPATFDTTGRTLQALITDCASGFFTGDVVSASILYSVDGEEMPPVPMVDFGWDTWEGNIPGQPARSDVSYRVSALDDSRAGTYGPPGSYHVHTFGSPWYAIDTTQACIPLDIGSTGTEVLSASFFSPGVSPTPPDPRNDGTAGPVDMGAGFTLFGETYRYAWIGVNGAIALSESPDDTAHVNRRGAYASGWTFPSPPPYDDSLSLPGPFIAPFWADHLLADSTGQYGRILYGDGGDACPFIVQGDDIGYAGSPGDTSGRSTSRTSSTGAPALLSSSTTTSGRRQTDSTISPACRLIGTR